MVNLPVNSLLGAWSAREFRSFDSSEVIEDFPSPMADINSFTRTIQKSFYEGLFYETHTITLRFTCDYANVPIGGDAIQRYRVTVEGKSMEVPDAPNYNSSTQSYLHVDDVELRQTSIPYTAWTSTTIDGEVQNNGSDGSLSASIGVSVGVLSLSYSVPVSFTEKGIVDINTTMTSYENYGNNYTRNISTKIEDGFKLTQIGHYFHVESNLRDYGNANRSSEQLKAIWIIDIINASNFQTWTCKYPHNVDISIN